VVRAGLPAGRSVRGPATPEWLTGPWKPPGAARELGAVTFAIKAVPAAAPESTVRPQGDVSTSSSATSS